MVDLDAASDRHIPATGSGLFTHVARKQYVALGMMRAQAFLNGFRTGSGAVEFGARAISFLVYTAIGLGLGAGAGAVAYSLASDHLLHFLAIEFWVLFVFWQAISVVLASFLEQFDLSSILRFPVNFGSFFLLHLVFGLFDVSTLAGGLCCAGVLIGTTIARPDLFGVTLLSLAGFAAFNIFLVRAILAWLDRWLAKRRSREIVSAIFLLSMLSLQFLNPALHDQSWPGRRHHTPAPQADRKLPLPAESWIKKVAALQVWLPPGLATVAMESADQHDLTRESGALGLICIYAVGAAGLLGIRLRAEYRGENLGEVPSAGRDAKRESRLLVGRGPIAAEIEKDLLTLSRSMTQIYAICVPPVMVVVIASLFRNGTSFNHRSSHLALPVCVAYGLLGFTQLIYNSLGAEGRAIQLVFLFPLRIRKILLAKNIFHGSLYLLAAVCSGLFTSLRLGRPDPDVVAMTAAWLAFALPANLTAGNLLSILMPYRINLGRIGRQSGSQANALLSMLIQTIILGTGATVMSVCSFTGKIWLAVPMFLVLAFLSVLAWILVLEKSDSLANSRKDALLTRLARIE